MSRNAFKYGDIKLDKKQHPQSCKLTLLELFSSAHKGLKAPEWCRVCSEWHKLCLLKKPTVPVPLSGSPASCLSLYLLQLRKLFWTSLEHWTRTPQHFGLFWGKQNFLFFFFFFNALKDDWEVSTIFTDIKSP